jgi:uncharacterized protein with PQ loop repeat
MWQDMVIGTISIAFTVCLLPQVIDVLKRKSKMNPYTSLTTTAGLWIMSICYITLDLWFSAVVTAITALLWGTMLFSHAHERRRSAGRKKD